MTINTVAHRIASVQESEVKCNASNSASVLCDYVNKHVSELPTSAQIPSNCNNCISVSISDVSGTLTDSKSEELLNVLKKEYPDIFSKSVGKTPTFEHKILLKPGAEPRRVKMRPIPLKKQDLVTAEIEKSIREGIFSPCPKSDWNSPLHVVNKPDGSVRLTGDFSQTINPNIIPSLHPLPRPEDIFRKVQNCKIFSKIDLTKGYWHIPLTEDSKPLTAFLTESHGLLMMERLPMGLSDSGAAFQKCVEEKLHGLDGVFPYIDDILIGGISFEQHKNQLLAVFKRLFENGFCVNEAKCIFGVESVSMLGQILKVTSSGLQISPDPDRCKPILEIPRPKTIKELQRFLGMANYFITYIPHLATITEPLLQLKRKRSQFIWNETCTSAVESIKHAVASPQVLVPFDSSAPVHLTTDASLVGLGAVLSIENAEGKLRPVCFASKIMTDAERNYSTPEQEALAAVWAMEKFNKYLFGQKFTLHSDQSSLQQLMKSYRSKAVTSRRIQRWVDRLQHYDYEVKYIKGQDNVVADFLSRVGEESAAS
ncbi:MAG: hypothetical protein GY795_01035, partial [Desulfobacterales bacterium]|nr:hypothetical protein [Desulfobacterales bacterium]